MPSWPSTLPTFTVDGYGIEPQAQFARTDMDQGPARQRRRFTAAPTRYPVRWLFTAAQMATFEAWHEYELYGGASAFTLPILGGLGFAEAEATFVEPWKASLVGPALFAVTATLEIRQRPIYGRFDYINAMGLPSLEFDFTTGSLAQVVRNQAQPVVTIAFSRSSSATYIGADGLIATADINAPRFDYDPVTLECRGLLVEEARTNLLVGSLADGTPLPTQDVAVSAVAFTLSFYGSGTVTLSGAYAAEVIGAGEYPTRTALTFTPAAGTVTLTVSGTVQFANLEAGDLATSFIPTADVPVDRAADSATALAASWLNPDEGTFVLGYSMDDAATASWSGIYAVDDGTDSNRFIAFADYGTGSLVLSATAAGAYQGGYAGPDEDGPVQHKFAHAYKLHAGAQCVDGGVVSLTDLGALPSGLTTLRLGAYASGQGPQKRLRRLAYYPKRLPDAQLQELTGA